MTAKWPYQRQRVACFHTFNLQNSHSNTCFHSQKCSTSLFCLEIQSRLKHHTRAWRITSAFCSIFSEHLYTDAYRIDYLLFCTLRTERSILQEPDYENHSLRLSSLQWVWYEKEFLPGSHTKSQLLLTVIVLGIFCISLLVNWVSVISWLARLALNYYGNESHVNLLRQ